jgi:hypothetical protein
MVRTGDPKVGMAREQTFCRPAKGLFRCSEQVDAITRTLGEPKKLVHEVNAGNPLREGVSKEPRSPHDSLPIRRHELGAGDDRLQLRIGAEGDDLGRIERHVL